MLKSKIDSFYEIHDCTRISQGDILRDISYITVGEDEKLLRIELPYIVVLSQDCDLQQGNRIISQDLECDGECKIFNQFLHSVLFVPAFRAETVRSGEYLSSPYKIKTKRIVSGLWKPIVQNQNPRYHYLSPDVDHQIPELLLDFKAYYTLSYRYFLSMHKEHYLATVNELFRENLSQRFANYLNRIGLPELFKQE